MENSKKSVSTSGRVKDRRKRAMKRLENQLLTGHKTIWENKQMSSVPLTEGDKIRIKHEIAILKSRI